MKYYKFLTEDNLGPHSDFDFTPYLPDGNEPGPWMPEVEHLEACKSGYHACKSDNLINWLGHTLWEVEYKAKPEELNNKVNGHQIRFLRRIDAWNERTARLFAVWCAREALKLIDNPDPRSVAACDIAERFANGEATQDELVAARDAAESAAWAAAWDAARAAARDAAWDAARDAARDAAWAAARAAARDAAWDADWDAARAAAWAAARAAARDAAWDADWDAARDAAWDAARDAAREAQTSKLCEMLGIEPV